MSTLRQRRPRVIVAMAHPQRRARVTRALREDAWTAVSVSDGLQLVDRLADGILAEDPTEAPDLIIADATMPGCTGITVLEGLRELQWTTPIIIIVDFNRPETLALADRLGASAVFEKPVNVDEIRAAAAAFRPTVPNPRRRRRHQDPARV